MSIRGVAREIFGSLLVIAIIALPIPLILAPWLISFLPDDVWRDIAYKNSLPLDLSIIYGLPFLGVLLPLVAVGLSKWTDYISMCLLSAFVAFVIGTVMIVGPAKWLNQDYRDRLSQTANVIELFETELNAVKRIVVNAEPVPFEEFAPETRLLSARAPNGILWLYDKKLAGRIPQSVEQIPTVVLDSFVPQGITYRDSSGNTKRWSVRIAAEGKIPDELEFDIGSLLVVVPGEERSGRVISPRQGWSIVEILSFVDLYYVDIVKQQRVKLPTRVFGPEVEVPMSLRPTVVVGGSASGSRVGDEPNRLLIVEQANNFFEEQPWTHEFQMQ